MASGGVNSDVPANRRAAIAHHASAVAPTIQSHPTHCPRFRPTKPIRERFGIAPGDAVVFELAPDGRIVLLMAGARSVSRFARLRGRAGPGLTTDEIMALTRGDD